MKKKNRTKGGFSTTGTKKTSPDLNKKKVRKQKKKKDIKG